jgi:hypothetical protein
MQGIEKHTIKDRVERANEGGEKERDSKREEGLREGWRE